MNCPICGKEIKEQFLGVRGSIISCENFCFENFIMKSPSCPVCNAGKMSKIKYHGNEYRQCDNNECNFEISSQSLITIMSKGICN
jgi:hypothetical protein